MSTDNSARESNPGKPAISQEGIPAHDEAQHSAQRPKPLPFDDGIEVADAGQTQDPQTPSPGSMV